MGVIITPEPRQDITVLPSDDPKKIRLGWRMLEPVIMVGDCTISVTLPEETVTLPEEKEEVIFYPIPKYHELYSDISNRFKLLDL